MRGEERDGIVNFNRAAIKQMALEDWQDDLAKFFPKSKEPTGAEYRMYEMGYARAVYRIRYVLEGLDKLEQENDDDLTR